MRNKVKNLFQRESNIFNRRYSEPNLIDRIFRKSVFARFEAVLREVNAIKCRSVLDVGCGAGFQALRLVQLGVDVMGIDFSENMIQTARQISSSYNMKDGPEFICADFLGYEFDRKFDIVIALGLFDYTSNPGDYLKKMKELANREIIASFPAKDKILWLQRKFRYSVFKNCPVYFYRKEDIENIVSVVGSRDCNILRIHRDYILQLFI